MCGIAGVLFKQPDQVGSALVAMLSGIDHRGPDSTGVALYGHAENYLKIRLHSNAKINSDHIGELIKLKLSHAEVELVEMDFLGDFINLKVGYNGNIISLCQAIEEIDGMHILSIGKMLEIIKDEGLALDIDKKFAISSFKGTHGIGHTRLATESDVDVRRAHPFWAYGIEDISIVHNGQLTNYYTLKRLLQQKGYHLRTDNDSELIAVYIADRLAEGFNLHQALSGSIEDFDGTFSYLIATKDGMGFAKDKLGVKPMVVLEGDNMVAVASEEVALRRAFNDPKLYYWEPGPKEVKTWLK